MKFIYTFIFSCFLMNGFSQDMKIGFLDKEEILLKMQEFQYLDSMRILVYEKNNALEELMIDEFEKKYNETIKRIYCSSPIVYQKAEKEFQVYEEIILNFEIEINESDSLYKEGIKHYCENIMNDEIETFMKQKDIHLLLDESAVIYAGNKTVYTNELIFVFEKREENSWNNSALIELSKSLGNQYDIVSEKIKEVVEFIFGNIK